MKDVLTSFEREVFDLYNASGRCAFLHPRKKTISRNGFRAKPIKESIKEMSEILERDASKK